MPFEPSESYVSFSMTSSKQKKHNHVYRESRVIERSCRIPNVLLCALPVDARYADLRYNDVRLETFNVRSEIK